MPQKECQDERIRARAEIVHAVIHSFTAKLPGSERLVKRRMHKFQTPIHISIHR
jgi:hypothetical protein